MLITSIHEDRSQITFLNSHTVFTIWSIPFSWTTGSYIEAFDMQYKFSLWSSYITLLW